MKKTKEQIMQEIFWLFRDAIHAGKHHQVMIEKSKISIYKKETISKEELDYTSCYVCKKLQELEREIAKIFGEEKYYHSITIKKNAK